MSRDDDLTVPEVAQLGRKLFGERFNCFHLDGVFHVGRFLDAGVYTSGPNAGREMSPHHRKQEVFGVGKSWREAFRFATGRVAAYSGAGLGPSSNTARGAHPVYDRYGRVRGWTSPAGIFSKNFPSQFIVTA